jgi:hypothetical protein
MDVRYDAKRDDLIEPDDTGLSSTVGELEKLAKALDAANRRGEPILRHRSRVHQGGVAISV